MPYYILNKESLNSCSNCKSQLSTKFVQTSPWIFAQTLYDANESDSIHFDEIPKTITIDNLQYRLICCTIHKILDKIGNFYAIFELEKRFFYR